MWIDSPEWNQCAWVQITALTFICCLVHGQVIELYAPVSCL